MTDDRWKFLMGNKLTQEEMSRGWHWCPEFDGLLVGPGMGEWDDGLCQCDVPGRNHPIGYHSSKTTSNGIRMDFCLHIVRPVITPRVRKLCTKPYPHHPKGCPNYGKRDTCPPACKMFDKVFHWDRDIWALWVEMDFGTHVSRMRALHPEWSRRQLECCLYWQGSARAYLRKMTDEWVAGHIPGNYLVTECPEAMGVNVTETMRSIGVTLEWPPMHIVRKIFMMGEVNEQESA